MHKYFIFRKTCRICNNRSLVKVLNLGSMPPANSFLKKNELAKKERKFPLVLYFCNKCKLAQLRHVCSPNLLFGDYYYLTSASRPLAEHFIKFGREITKKFIRSRNDLVIEIGSNDGTLLASLRSRCRVLGVDPAKNLAGLARSKGVETIVDFFGARVARGILKKRGSAKVIVANNVIAHIDDLSDVFKGVGELLADDGVFVFEVHWVGNLIGRGGFDQIYHEHLSYFSLTALKTLAVLNDFVIRDVELVPIHGQSLRVYMTRRDPSSKRAREFLKKERRLGLADKKTYLKFAKKVKKNKIDLQKFLNKIKKNGKIIAGYGAPAKGNTLLNYCGLDSSVISFIVDTTPFKQGKYTPGAHIPIYPPAKLKEVKPDYLLLLAWNYADVIMRKEIDFHNRGGKFIIPVPKLHII